MGCSRQILLLCSYSVGNRLSKECNQVEIVEVKKERTLMK